MSSSSLRFKAESSDPGERDLARRLQQAEEAVQGWCRERNMAWTIFRPTLIYDPGHDHNITAIADFVRRYRLFPIVWPGTGLRQPIHAEDVALAMLAALDAEGAQDRVVDLPGGETLPYHEMVRRVFRAVGQTPLLLYLPLGLAQAAFALWKKLTGVKYSVASLARMNEDLALDPEGPQKTLGLTCRPFRPVFPGPAGDDR